MSRATLLGPAEIRDLADLLHLAGRRHVLDFVYGLLAR